MEKQGQIYGRTIKGARVRQWDSEVFALRQLCIENPLETRTELRDGREFVVKVLPSLQDLSRDLGG